MNAILRAVSPVFLLVSLFQTPTVRDDELSSLRSADWRDNEQGLAALKNTPEGLRSPPVQALLLNILERENANLESKIRAHIIGSEGYIGEGEAGFIAAVLGLLSESGDLNNDRVLKALIHSSYHPTSQFAVKLSQEHGARALPMVLDMFKNSLREMRSQAFEMLDTIAAQNPSFPQQAIATIRTTAISASGDNELYIRQVAARILGRVGDSRDIALLQRLAQGDRGTSYGTTRRYYLRDQALASVEMIRQRTGK